ncbi:MAG: hypothetical protein IPJ03_22025 [Ignavibacteriales bacterium]|nr:hypothetical protein [Ignavibacteriales bacterium]
MKLKFAGIKRQTDFSPNHIENDSLIFMKTTESLIELGAEVKLYDEEEVNQIEIKEELIFSMAQGREANIKLLKKTEAGALIINSPQSVLNCHRLNMVKLLPGSNIPFPKSICGSLEEMKKIQFDSFNCRKIWIKRGDVHAVHSEDVTLVYSENEKNVTLKEFARRGINTAVLQEHLDGDVVKFYSVNGSDLFHWYYLNGIDHTEFDEKKLNELAVKSAAALSLEIFGGDAVIAKDSSVKIIDINDWPSFAPIKDKASKKIAKLIYERAKRYVHNRTTNKTYADQN